MHIVAMAINPPKLLFNGFISGGTFTNTYTKLSDKCTLYFVRSLLWKSQLSGQFFGENFLIEVFRRRTALCSEPQNCLEKIIIIIHLTVVTLRLSALLFWTPPVTPPPLLDILCVAKQYLAKTLLTSWECICCKATMGILKNPKIRRRREQLGVVVISVTQLFSLLTVLGGVGQAAMWVCISVFCIGVYSTSISSSYDFFLFRSSLCYVHLSWRQWCL